MLVGWDEESIKKKITFDFPLAKSTIVLQAHHQRYPHYNKTNINNNISIVAGTRHHGQIFGMTRM